MPYLNVTQQIDKVNTIATAVEEVSVVNLNDRIAGMSDEGMVNTFANYAVQTEKWKKLAFDSLQKPGALSPGELIALQNHVLNYNVEVSLVGTLTKKAVAAVETLLRS